VTLCTAHCLLLIPPCCLLLINNCSLLTAHCSLLTADSLLLTAYCSLLSAHLLSAHCALLPAAYTLVYCCSLLCCSSLYLVPAALHFSLLTAHVLNFALLGICCMLCSPPIGLCCKAACSIWLTALLTCFFYILHVQENCWI
jgi:hypothetical protein